MGCIAKIRHLVAHARAKREGTAIAQFGIEYAFQHVRHVPAVAPVIGKISGGIFDHPDPNVADVQGTPERLTAFAGMRGGVDLALIGDGERQRGNLHSATSSVLVFGPDDIGWRANVTAFYAVIAPPLQTPSLDAAVCGTLCYKLRKVASPLGRCVMAGGKASLVGVE